MAASNQVRITYFVHGATADNERGIASGWANPGLSALGRRQALQLKKRIRWKMFDVVFCSDLKRAAETARQAFGRDAPVILDKRLRECNYGDLTRHSAAEVDSLMEAHIDAPFPGGESYRAVEQRMNSFLGTLKETCNDKSVAVVAHRAPQLALDVLLKGKTWQQAMKEDWRRQNPKAWQPGWEYLLVALVPK